MPSTTVSTTTASVTPATKGVRPEVKIGGDLSLSQNDGTTGTPTGTWNFSYHPGDQNISMQVQADQNCMLTTSSSNNGLTMEIDQDGINDIISWLCGVKNLVSEAVKDSAKQAKSDQSNSSSDSTGTAQK